MRQRIPEPRRRLMAAMVSGVLLLFGGAPSGALDEISLDVADLRGSGVSAHGITVRLSVPDAHHMMAQVHIASLEAGRDIGTVRNLVIDCPAPEIRDDHYRCSRASVRADLPRIGAQRFGARLDWDQRSHRLRFAVSGLALGEGRVALEGQWDTHGWQVALEGQGLALAVLWKLAGDRLPAMPGWSMEGSLRSVHASLEGGEALRRASIRLEAEAIALGNPDGTIATDQLAAQLQLDIARRQDRWTLEGSANSAHGEALGGRWYWNFSQQPARASWRGAWRDDGVLVLETAEAGLGGFANARFEGEIGTASGPRLRRLGLSIGDVDMAALPPQTRDGLLAGSPVAQLQGKGHLRGRIDVENDAPVFADLALEALSLEDRSARLGIEELSGQLRWESLARRRQRAASESADTQSQLGWKTALLYGVALGAAQARFTTASSDVRLLQPMRIPILDGGLDLKLLQLRRIGDPAMNIRFDATLDPISVGLLCRAFGWPEFSGKLSGRIPDLTLESGVLTLGGALEASVFDGTLTVDKLRLSDALGARPRLAADVDFRRLDLAAITSAFSVGRITGRLDGRISGLELVGWEPVAFDARLESTPGDHSRRRISQRAVQNISSIGGGLGAAAALQRSALRFFDEFNYARLGISCRLTNDVCLMDGVEPHPPGYYLVKGWGLPRIDVIGNSRRVDWPRLVATLKALPESQAAIGEAP